jgi:hypothetical protein
MKIRNMAAVLAAAAMVGCTSTKLSGPDGWSMKRFTLLQKSDIKSVSLGAARMEGYRNDGGAGAIEVMVDMMAKYQMGQISLIQAKGEIEALKAAALATQTVPAPIVAPPVVAPVPEPKPAGGATNDAANITGATLLGPNAGLGDPADAAITVHLDGARLEGGKLWLDYADVPDWPNADGEPGCSGRNYLYWAGPDGALRGGHFEWSTNGRRDRGLGNIYEGYLGEVPPAGAACFTVVVRNNFSERSNVVACGAWPG